MSNFFRYIKNSAELLGLNVHIKLTKWSPHNLLCRHSPLLFVNCLYPKRDEDIDDGALYPPDSWHYGKHNRWEEEGREREQRPTPHQCGWPKGHFLYDGNLLHRRCFMRINSVRLMICPVVCLCWGELNQGRHSSCFILRTESTSSASPPPPHQCVPIRRLSLSLKHVFVSL